MSMIEKSGTIADRARSFSDKKTVGESWPLPMSRSFFEHEALSRQAARDPGRVPEIHHFDRGQALVVMRFLTPRRILRKSLVDGTFHPNLAEHLGLFMAYCAQRGHEARAGARDDYRRWILSVVAESWAVFEREFRTLWRTQRAIWVDTLGYCGVEMRRRILGLAGLFAERRAA